MTKTVPLPKITEEKWYMRWRHFAAYTYLLICIFDFIIMPIVFEASNRIDPVDVVTLTLKYTDPSSQQIALTTLMNKRAWQPITLDGTGTFHLAFGAILGAAAWTRGRERYENARSSRIRPDNPDN